MKEKVASIKKVWFVIAVVCLEAKYLDALLYADLPPCIKNFERKICIYSTVQICTVLFPHGIFKVIEIKSENDDLLVDSITNREI